MTKNHNKKSLISLLLALCMVLAIVPITAFAANDQEITLVDFGNVWKDLDSTKPVVFTTELNPNTDCPNQMEITDQVWLESENGPSLSSGSYPEAGKEYCYQITLTAKEGYFFPTRLVGVFNGTVIIDGVNNDDLYNPAITFVVDDSLKTLVVMGYPVVTATNGTSQDDYVIDNVVINNAPTSCTAGEAPKAMATKGDDEAYTFYEYWEEWAETEEGLEPVKFWYSNKDVSADQRITAFEEGKTYSYSIIAKANENYTFASKDDGLSVMLNGVDYTDKSGVILDGTGLMIGPGPFMTPTTPATQKEIPVVEINNATVSFKAGDEPVFTGTTPDGALYAIDYEGWFGEDNEFISSSDDWNSAYVERDWCDGLISSFKADTEYTYQLYLKLTDEAAAQGYVFGPNTKLEVNGLEVEYPHSGETTSAALMIGTDLTMTPTTPATQKEIPVVEINNATLTFKDGDKPVFTGTTPDDALYVLVFEEWRTDGEWTRSDEWFNDADHHGEDKDITAFDKNKTYHYNLYLKTTAAGSEEGWDFGPNTKLKINGEEVSFTFTNNDPGVFMVTTGITMTPTAAGASDYKIIEGANGAWTQNSDGTLVFRANGDFSKFTGVKVDGTLIDAKNYTAVSGSTVITLKTDYLKTLSVGTHKLTVVYTDGECSTEFEVKSASATQSTASKSPDTGSNGLNALWFAMLLASGAGLAVIPAFAKRKKQVK